MKYRATFTIMAIFFVVGLSSSVLAWSSKTHMFIAQEAGMADPVSACFPDFSRNEEYNLLVPYHWHDAAPNTIVTPKYIDRFQVSEETYRAKPDFPRSLPMKIRVPDPRGVLYWEIVELYKNLKASTTQWEHAYYLSNIAHYVAICLNPFTISPMTALLPVTERFILNWGNGTKSITPNLTMPWIPSCLLAPKRGNISGR